MTYIVFALFKTILPMLNGDKKENQPSSESSKSGFEFFQQYLFFLGLIVFGMVHFFCFYFIKEFSENYQKFKMMEIAKNNETLIGIINESSYNENL